MAGAKTLFWDPAKLNWLNPATGQYLAPVTTNPRDSFIIGTTVPVVGVNVGVIPGRTLTTNTRTTITGTTVEEFRDMVFPNKITIQGSNKSFYNCQFEGRTGTSECVAAYDTANTNLYFEDCTFAQPAELFPAGYVGTSNGKMGFRGHHVTLKRCAFYNVVDGFRPRRTGGGDASFQALGCHVSNLLFLSPDTGQSNLQSHSDTMQDDQVAAQANVLVDGCWLDGHLNPNLAQAALPASYDENGVRTGGNLQYPWLTCNATIQMSSPTSGTKDNYVFTRNWMFGGSVLFNAGGLHDVDLTFTNNRCGRDMRNGPDWVMNIPNVFVFTAFTGNTYYDDGTPANVRHNG